MLGLNQVSGARKRTNSLLTMNIRYLLEDCCGYQRPREMQTGTLGSFSSRKLQVKMNDGYNYMAKHWELALLPKGKIH